MSQIIELKSQVENASAELTRTKMIRKEARQKFQNAEWKFTQLVKDMHDLEHAVSVLTNILCATGSSKHVGAAEGTE